MSTYKISDKSDAESLCGIRGVSPGGFGVGGAGCFARWVWNVHGLRWNGVPRLEQAGGTPESLATEPKSASCERRMGRGCFAKIFGGWRK